MSEGIAPVFPCEVSYPAEPQDHVQGRQTGNSTGIAIGLTKREWFAGLALIGLLSRPEDYTRSEAARYAMEAADVLIEQLNAK